MLVDDSDERQKDVQPKPRRDRERDPRVTERDFLVNRLLEAVRASGVRLENDEGQDLFTDVLRYGIQREKSKLQRAVWRSRIAWALFATAVGGLGHVASSLHGSLTEWLRGPTH